MTPKHEPHQPRPDADEMAGLPLLEQYHQAEADLPHLNTRRPLLATAIGYALGLAMMALLVHIVLEKI